MASAKKDVAGGGAPAEVTKKPLLAEFLTEADGVSEQDVKLTGQLLPMFLGKQTLEIAAAKGIKVEDIVPAVGIFNHVAVLPLQERKGKGGKVEIFAPFSLALYDLRGPCTGFRGSGQERVPVEVEKGGAILVPVTGQTGVNQDIMQMIRDVDGIYLVLAKPIGTKLVNDQPSEMIDWHIEVVKLPNQKRSDKGARYALPAWYTICVAAGAITDSIRNGEHTNLLAMAQNEGIDVNAAGFFFNRKTGDVLGRLGPNGNVLPPEKQLAPVGNEPASSAAPS